MAKFYFTIGDNSGKRHNYIITASDKATAIKKGFDKARKNARGDLNLTFNCTLKSV